MRKPGVSRGTRNMVVPCLSGAWGSVRASMKNSLPTGALAMKHFSPLRIHSSPWRSARSFSPALGSSAGGRRLSEPAPGSEMPLPSRKVSSATKGLRKRAFCSGVQACEIRWLHFQFWLKVFEIALSARASSAMTRAWVTKSVPWPPYSLGTAMVRKPSFEPFLTISQSKVSGAVGMASRASDMGRISSSANWRAVICQWRCSLLNAKSMMASLGGTEKLFGRDGRRRRAVIARQRLGNAKLGFTIAAAAVVQGDAGVVNVFLHRDVTHHAHGAEHFGGVLGCFEHRL